MKEVSLETPNSSVQVAPGTQPAVIASTTSATRPQGPRFDCVSQPTLSVLYRPVLSGQLLPSTHGRSPVSGDGVTTTVTKNQDGSTTTVIDGPRVRTTIWDDGKGYKTTIVDGKDTGKTITDETDDGKGHKTWTTVTYDIQGRNAGTIIIDERDARNGRASKTTTKVEYDAEGCDAGRTIIETATDGDGRTTLTITNFDRNGRVTGSYAINK